MPTIVVAYGKIDSEVNVRQVGTPSKKVADFRLNDGRSWYSVTAWEDVADRIPPAGSFVVLHGRLNARSYENKTGQKVNVVEIVASSIDQLRADGMAPGEPTGLSPARPTIEDGFGD